MENCLGKRAPILPSVDETLKEADTREEVLRSRRELESEKWPRKQQDKSEVQSTLMGSSELEKPTSNKSEKAATGL